MATSCWVFLFTSTCCAISAALHWRTQTTTHARYKIGLVTEQSNTPSGTPSYTNQVQGVLAALSWPHSTSIMDGVISSPLVGPSFIGRPILFALASEASVR